MAAEASAESVLCLSLNQNNTCFTVGTTQGFRVYELNPVRLRFRRGLLPHLFQGFQASSDCNKMNC